MDYTDEQAQDAVGSILTDSATIDFTYDDPANTITADVKDGSVTNAKLARVATGTIKGRALTGTGQLQDLSPTQVRALINVQNGATAAGAAGDAFAKTHAGAGGTAHATATAAQAGFLSAADKAKLDTIQAGAQANTVTSVAGKTGAVSLGKADVGLGNVADAAQLTRNANDWALFPAKTAPATTDRLLIEDSAQAGAKKTIRIGDLPSGSGSGGISAASNVNIAGVGVFKAKSGDTLQFRGVKANSARVSVSSADTDTCVGIDVAEQHLRLENIGGTIKDGGAHGTHGGGSLHAAATPSTAGFMTPQDKAKLDGIEPGATADQSGAEIVAAINGELGGTAWQQSGSATVSGRGITAPTSDDPSLNLELPPAVNRRDFLLGFTATGAVTTTQVATAKDVDDLAVRGLRSVNTIAELRQIQPGKAGTPFLLRGYHAPGDGGGGVFEWDANSAAADNGGTLIRPAVSSKGRWRR
ncbi:MAG: hypothetical protein MUE49_08150, partial [Rhodospirillales bacterium]|nr:hypothetical protein [Rhodospirillales bacterium]